MGFFDKLKKAASGAMSNTPADAHTKKRAETSGYEPEFDQIIDMDKIDDSVNRFVDNVDKGSETFLKGLEKGSDFLMNKLENGFNRNKRNETPAATPVQEPEAVQPTSEGEPQPDNERNEGKSFSDYITKARSGIGKAIDYAEKNPEVVAAAVAAGGLLAGFAKKKLSERAEKKAADKSSSREDYRYSDDDEEDYSYSSDDNDDDRSYSSSNKKNSDKKSSSKKSSSSPSSSKKSGGINSNVWAAEAKLNQAKIQLGIEKRAKEQAKKNGNYKNSPIGGYEGHQGNAYDRSIYYAQKRVKQCQEELRRAKSK